MKIGVLSDTHLSQATDALIRIARGAFSDVSLIIHAGDLTSMSVLDVFSDRQVIAVCGNKDRKPISDFLPEKQMLNVNGYRIGVVHGWGGANGIEDRVMSCFEDVHCIVFGHTHKPKNCIHSGILLFNPGAFSGSRFLKRNPTAGILTIGNGISGSIIPVD
jgi:putative phosphoesterase